MIEIPTIDFTVRGIPVTNQTKPQIIDTTTTGNTTYQFFGHDASVADVILKTVVDGSGNTVGQYRCHRGLWVNRASLSYVNLYA